MSAQDLSSLSSLSPTYKCGIAWSQYKNSQVYQGTHNLFLRQPSRDPVHARAYTPGDPVNLVDWKAYARSDQLIVRQRQPEASARIVIALDIGDSMFWPDASLRDLLGDEVVSKFEVALRVACHLAYAHCKAGDHVNVVLLNRDSGALEYQQIAGLRSCQDVVRVFAQAEATKFAADQWREGLALLPYEPRSCDVLLLLSDAIADDFAQTFTSIDAPRRWLLQIVSHLEADPQWLRRGVTYFEAASSAREFIGGELIADNLLGQEIAAWLERVEATVRAHAAQRVVFSEHTSIGAYELWLASATVED